jgi:hypothetical protein
LTYRNPRSFAAGTVLARVGKYLLHLRLKHIVSVDMRRISFRIDVKTQFHVAGIEKTLSDA